MCFWLQADLRVDVGEDRFWPGTDASTRHRLPKDSKLKLRGPRHFQHLNHVSTMQSDAANEPGRRDFRWRQRLVGDQPQLTRLEVELRSSPMQLDL